MLKRVWLMMLVAVALLVAGCSIPGTEMPDDGPPIPVTEEAAASLEQKVAAAALTSGQTSVTVTQEEVTSYLALRIASPEVPLYEPQLYFKGDGEMVLRAMIDFEGQRQPIRVAARPQAEAGSLAVDITSGRLGPVPVPGPILDQLEGYLAEAIVAGQDYARLDAVTVEGGAMTIAGERQ